MLMGWFSLRCARRGRELEATERGTSRLVVQLVLIAPRPTVSCACSPGGQIGRRAWGRGWTVRLRNGSMLAMGNGAMGSCWGKILSLRMLDSVWSRSPRRWAGAMGGRNCTRDDILIGLQYGAHRLAVKLEG